MSIVRVTTAATVEDKYNYRKSPNGECGCGGVAPENGQVELTPEGDGNA